jgi:hypothetical protein
VQHEHQSAYFDCGERKCKHHRLLGTADDDVQQLAACLPAEAVCSAGVLAFFFVTFTHCACTMLLHLCRRGQLCDAGG